MLWPSDSLAAVFAQIKKHSQGVELCTLILTALDTDGVCATEMLSSALKSDNVLHAVHGVRGGFGRVHDALLPLLEQGSFKCIVLVNCGGGVDLAAKYGEFLAEGVYVFVVDSYRPLAHQNLLPSTGQIIVLGGEITKFDEDVIPSGDLPGEEEEDGEGESEESEEEEEEEETFGEGARSSPPVKRAKRDTEREERKEALKQLARLHQEYYTGSYLGDPSAHVMFQLCSQAGKESNSLVWAALVGITSRYALTTDLDDSSYAFLLHSYQEQVQNRNLHVKLYRESVDDHRTKIPNASAQDQIEFVPHEINLTLYRNWSLVEACKHTELFASRFKAWTLSSAEHGNEDGSGELHMFFAKMGLSLGNAEQKFQYMDRSAKRLVRGKMLETALTYQYSRMTYPSFVLRSMGFDLEVSAEDCARCVAVSLQRGGGAQDFSTASALLRHGRRNKREWNLAMEACLSQARLVHAETLATIQGNLIQNAGEFRWAFLDLHEDEDAGGGGGGGGGEGGDGEEEEGTSTERGEFFSTASGVVTLAQAIIRANFEKWLAHQTIKPLVLVVNHRGRALVCGLPCPGELGTVQKNPFGKIFRNTLAALQLDRDVAVDEFQYDFVVRLDAGEVQRFLLTLAKS